MAITQTTLSATIEKPLPLSIRILRKLKPLVLGILESPLHGILSRDILQMTYRGRRSGKVYDLPLSYVPAASPGAIYLCTRPQESAWWRNLKDGGSVELLLRGRKVTAQATVLPPASVEALDGLRRFLTRNPATGELLYSVRRSPQGPVEEDLLAEVQRSVVVQLLVEPAASSGSR